MFSKKEFEVLSVLVWSIPVQNYFFMKNNYYYHYSRLHVSILTCWSAPVCVCLHTAAQRHWLHRLTAINNASCVQAIIWFRVIFYNIEQVIFDLRIDLTIKQIITVTFTEFLCVKSKNKRDNPTTYAEITRRLPAGKMNIKNNKKSIYIFKYFTMLFLRDIMIGYWLFQIML